MDKILTRIREEKPLVHQITNFVTVGDLADITLYWGGLPVMAFHQEEAAQMAESAAALVLNLGAMDGGDEQIEAMKRAGKRANDLGIPVIFDPVGVGATKLRTELANQLLAEIEFAVIKGNAGEISVLAGGEGRVKGVEAMGEPADIGGEAQKLARRQGSVVVVSQAEDLVTDGGETYQIANGHRLMGQVVGTGCALGSTLGVFCGVVDDYLAVSCQAVAAYGVAGELASQEAERPASYKVAFQDNISQLTDQKLAARRKIKIYDKKEAGR